MLEEGQLMLAFFASVKQMSLKSAILGVRILCSQAESHLRVIKFKSQRIA